MSGDAWMTLFILGVTGLLIAANALFVFHEFAFVMLKPFQIRQFSVRDTWIAHTIVKAAHRLDHYIAVDQLGITATSIGVGWIGQPVVNRLIRGPFEQFDAIAQIVAVVSFATAFALLTMVQMVFGELIPKTIALRHPERVASQVSGPVEIVAWLLHPLVVLLNGLGLLAVRAVGVTPHPEAHLRDLPPEDLEAVIARSVTAGRIQADPLNVRRALHFSDLEARDIIVPRQEVVAVDLSMTLEEVLRVAKDQHFTRYPVVDGSIDNVVGLLNVKELFQLDDHQQPIVVTSWQDAVRPMPVLPESASIETVLQKLVLEQEQMTLLVDEFGGTGGIVTVTDIAAEATGSSLDIVPLATDSFLVAGETAVSMVESVLDLSLESGEDGYETIAGLVMAVLGRIPAMGEEVIVNDVEIRVHRMKGHRISQVVLTRPSRQPFDFE
jgi:putative hemolysin